MAAEPAMPLASYHFMVEITGMNAAFFQEAGGLSSESEKIEYKASGKQGEDLILSQPGRTKYPDITFKRGMTDAKDFWDWRKDIEQGKFKDSQKNGSITLYDQAHTAVARWSFTKAWPSKIESGGFNSGGNEVMLETLTLVCQTVTRDQ